MTTQEARHYAALCYALACTRGQLYGVLDGTVELERVRETLDATATASIARAVGSTETELTLDWNEHLTDAEKDLINGHTKHV